MRLNNTVAVWARVVPVANKPAPTAATSAITNAVCRTRTRPETCRCVPEPFINLNVYLLDEMTGPVFLSPTLSSYNAPKTHACSRTVNSF